MSYFPFFIEIAGKSCLIVGGGTVALRKAEKLAPFGVRITAVAPAFCSGMQGLRDICRIERPFLPEDIEGKAFVIGATDDAAVNAEISRHCREKGIPVNIVDDRENCTFFFPALIKRGEFVAGFSSGGNSPLAARYIRERVEESIPPRFGDMVALLGAFREQAMREIPDGQEREAALRRLFALALERDGNVTREDLEYLLKGEEGHEGQP